MVLASTAASGWLTGQPHLRRFCHCQEESMKNKWSHEPNRYIQIHLVLCSLLVIPTCSRTGLAFNFCFMLSIEKAMLKKKFNMFFFLNTEKQICGQTVDSPTLLQAYPSYSRNKCREHCASLLASTLSESGPVGIFKATKASAFRTHPIMWQNQDLNKKRSSVKAEINLNTGRSIKDCNSPIKNAKCPFHLKSEVHMSCPHTQTHVWVIVLSHYWNASLQWHYNVQLYLVYQ